jgi:hypothetical protein
MPAEKDYVEDLQTILDALAESVIEEPDGQLLAEVKESGQNPNVLLAHVKGVLRQAVKQTQQRPLRDSRKAYEARLSALQRTSYALPESADERRTLFMNVVAQNPSVGGMLTAHFREFDKLEDDDITSCLRQLADLGFLDDDSERDSGDR